MSSQADALAARVKAFADRVLKFVRTLPHEPRIENMLRQLIDCSSAASANYRAARRGRSRKEFIAKLGLVVEEADEAENWLEVLTNAAVASTPARAKELASLLEESHQLRAIFVQSHATAKSNYERTLAAGARRPNRPRSSNP